VKSSTWQLALRQDKVFSKSALIRGEGFAPGTRTLSSIRRSGIKTFPSR
jgi:hypothetical protein